VVRSPIWLAVTAATHAWSSFAWSLMWCLAMYHTSMKVERVTARASTGRGSASTAAPDSPGQQRVQGSERGSVAYRDPVDQDTRDCGRCGRHYFDHVSLPVRSMQNGAPPGSGAAIVGAYRPGGR
jgi:hypothetical protein